MKRKPKRVCIAIMIVLSLVAVSIPFWNFENRDKIGLLARNYIDTPIVTRIGSFDSLVIVDDSMVSSVVKPNVVALTNKNGYDKDCKLYLLVEKRSTIPYQFLRVSINDEIFHLEKLEFEDDDAYYFYLKDYQIEAYAEKEFNARIWLSQDTNGVESNAILITNIIVK